MLNRKAFSAKEYNTQLQLVSDLRAELAATTSALDAERSKSKSLRKRLRDQRARHEKDIVAISVQSQRNADERVAVLTREAESRVEELRRIHDKTKRENEHLRLASQTGAKIRGNLENIKERIPDKGYYRIMAGGRAGSI